MWLSISLKVRVFKVNPTLLFSVENSCVNCGRAMCLHGKRTRSLVHEASPELRSNSVYIGMGGMVHKPLIPDP